MREYAAFLRGINLPGRRVAGAELRAPFERLGLRQVSTFLASGNVVFDTEDQPEDTLVSRIEEALVESLGYDVTVFLRTADEVGAIAEYEPFARGRIAASSGKLQVALLSARPTKKLRNAVLALSTNEDALAFGRRELYWLPSGGILESALDMNALGKLLGSTTMRTKNTVDRLAAKYFAA